MMDIPDEFRENAFKDYLRIATGNAIISAQYVERVFNAICLVLKMEKLPFNLDDFTSGDSSRMRQTLGAMARRIENTNLFSDLFLNQMTEFVKRRNRLVHGLFCDTFKDRGQIHPNEEIAQRYVAECEWVSNMAAELVETGFGIYAELVDCQNLENDELSKIINEFDEYRLRGSNALK